MHFAYAYNAKIHKWTKYKDCKQLKKSLHLWVAILELLIYDFQFLFFAMGFFNALLRGLGSRGA